VTHVIALQKFLASSPNTSAPLTSIPGSHRVKDREMKLICLFRGLLTIMKNSLKWETNLNISTKNRRKRSGLFVKGSNRKCCYKLKTDEALKSSDTCSIAYRTKNKG